MLLSSWVLEILFNMLGNSDNLPDVHAEHMSKLQNYSDTLKHVWKFKKYFALPVPALGQVSKIGLESNESINY